MVVVLWVRSLTDSEEVADEYHDLAATARLELEGTSTQDSPRRGSMRGRVEVPRWRSHRVDNERVVQGTSLSARRYDRGDHRRPMLLRKGGS